MRRLELALAGGLVLALAGLAQAEDAQVHPRLTQGRALLLENRCNGSCHQSHSADNEALSLYTRENRKVRDLAELDRMVKLCIHAVGAPIFPEDVADVVFALNRDHYKLPEPPEAKP